jgi:uncharacterized protein (TIGR00369 family)
MSNATSAFKPAFADYASKLRTSFAKQGLMTLFGAKLTEVEPGRITIDVALDARLTQQAGYFHGGVIGALADSAGGYAALSLLPAEAEVVTIEYKINFMRPATGSLLRATGQVIRPGRSVTVTRMDCTSGSATDQQPCAVLQATFMRVDPPT